MNIKSTFSLGVAVVVFASTPAVQATDLSAAATEASALVNRLIFASPHELESFPWLLRQSLPPTDTTVVSESALATIRKNRALTSSPRMKEQFPELSRAAQPSAPVRSTAPGLSKLDRIIKNQALASSPRMKEEFPELARGSTSQPTEDAFVVAPVK